MRCKLGPSEFWLGHLGKSVWYVHWYEAKNTHSTQQTLYMPVSILTWKRKKTNKVILLYAFLEFGYMRPEDLLLNARNGSSRHTENFRSKRRNIYTSLHPCSRTGKNACHETNMKKFALLGSENSTVKFNWQCRRRIIKQQISQSEEEMRRGRGQSSETRSGDS